MFQSLACASLALTLLGLTACSPESASAPAPSSPVPTSNATATPPGGNIEVGNCGSYRAADNSLANGDFEGPTVSGDNQTFAAGSGFTNWKVDLGSVALIAGGFAKPSGNQAVALGGTLSQDVVTFPGKTYLLSFCYGTTPGAKAGGLEVKWGNESVATLALDAASNIVAFKGVKIKLTAKTAKTQLSINGAGALIDTIRLELVP